MIERSTNKCISLVCIPLKNGCSIALILREVDVREVDNVLSSSPKYNSPKMRVNNSLEKRGISERGIASDIVLSIISLSKNATFSRGQIEREIYISNVV